MTALAITPSSTGLAQQERAEPSPFVMGAGLPAPIRTVGALALLLLAVAVTGLVLVAAAIALPVLLLVALVARRMPRGERQGWREVPA